MKPTAARHPGHWILTFLLGAGAAASVTGAVLALVPHESWRWVTWSGLVVFALGVVVGWWWAAPEPLPAPGPEGTRAKNDPDERQLRTAGGYWLTRVLANRLEPFFAWLVAYPLFPLQIVAFWAIAWFDLAGGLGVPDLVWGDKNWMQFWVGISVSLLFSNVLFVRAILDRRPGSVPPYFGERWSLFWFARAKEGERPVIRRVGAFLLRTWLPALVVFYIPYFGRDWFAPDNDWPGTMLFALSLGVLVTVGLVAFYEFRLSTWWENSSFFKSLPAFREPDPTVDRADRPLHAVAGILTVLPAVGAGLLLFEMAFFSAIWSPVWLFCLFAALFNSVYGFVTFHLAGLQYVLALLAALLVFVSNTNNPNRMIHPGLEDYTTRPVNLDESPEVPNPGLDLIETPALLETFHLAKWAKIKPGATPPSGKPLGHNEKPKLVIVATTGGGIQAAAWTGIVLERLEAAMPGNGKEQAAFRDHIRLITGASGGTQAASLYVADFENSTKSVPLSELLAEDSLWPTFQTMLVHDLPYLAWPGRLEVDRGRSLENRWEYNTSWTKGGRPALPPPNRFQRELKKDYATGPSPLAKPFHDLRHAERTCDRPTLVLSPMLVEDCRRLLISNLSMKWFTETYSANMNPQAWYQPENNPELTSVPAIEFWRYFPRARDKLKVSTAARMAATFPFVGPAVSLPTTPPRRVVDAGYFDNFGMNMAGIWLYQHRELIKAHTSGVVIVEVRAYPRRVEKLRFDAWNPKSGDEHPPGGFNWAFAEVGSPFSALYNLYARSAYFRNDQLVDALDLEFNGPRDTRPAPFQPFFTTVCFECDQGGSLNWTLPRQDFEAIKSEFNDPSDTDPPKIHAKRVQIQKAVQNLKAWFGDGGTRP